MAEKKNTNAAPSTEELQKLLAAKEAELQAEKEKAAKLQEDLKRGNVSATKVVPGTFTSKAAKTKGKTYKFRDNQTHFLAKGVKYESAELMKAAADEGHELYATANEQLERLVKLKASILVEQ